MEHCGPANAESDYDNTENDDSQLISLIMNEKKMSISRDVSILEKRQQLKSELISLYNVSLDEAVSAPEIVDPHINSTIVTDCDVCSNYGGDDEKEIIQEIDLIAPANDNSTDTLKINDVIVNCIQDENVKNQLCRLNEQLRNNINKCRVVAAEAKSTLAEKLVLIRECKIVEDKILKYSVEEARLKRIKRKKGKDCAETGNHRNTYFCRFGIPYFKTRQRYPADKNKDYKEIIESNQILLSRLPRSRRFLRKDAEVLDNVVLNQLKSKRIEQLKGLLKQIRKNDDLDKSDEQYEKEKRIYDAIIQTSHVDNVNDTIEWNIPVDFMSLIRVQNYRFTAEDYERIWNLLANPALSREDFTLEEISKLKKLVNKYGAQDWDKIARLLGPKRSGFMCFTKFVSIEKKGKNVRWTSEEDELLRTLCGKLSKIKKSGSRYHWWRNIRRHFPNRTYSQIHAHWSYVLAPKLKKGRFSEQEHEIIEQMVKEGKSFKEIAKMVPGRSCVQIRSHYEQKIFAQQQTLNSGPWTNEEKNLLLELVKEYGDKNWVAISQQMKTRTRTQCRLKYLQFRKNPQQFSDGESNSQQQQFRKGRWTPEENQLFVQLLQKYGHSWAEISKEMKTRSRFQCSFKYTNEFKPKNKPSTSVNSTVQS